MSSAVFLHPVVPPAISIISGTQCPAAITGSSRRAPPRGASSRLVSLVDPLRDALPEVRNEFGSALVAPDCRADPVDGLEQAVETVDIER